jgi:DNA helicase HerA-like ATPase
MSKPVLNLGAWRDLEGVPGESPLTMPAHHLVTHAVVVGMTGSGKTGLVTVLVEEAARAQVPTLVVDVKGDLSNLLLRFPDFSPAAFEPWVERERDDLPPEELARRAQELAERQAAALRSTCSPRSSARPTAGRATPSSRATR